MQLIANPLVWTLDWKPNHNRRERVENNGLHSLYRNSPFTVGLAQIHSTLRPYDLESVGKEDR